MPYLPYFLLKLLSNTNINNTYYNMRAQILSNENSFRFVA